MSKTEAMDYWHKRCVELELELCKRGNEVVSQGYRYRLKISELEVELEIERGTVAKAIAQAVEGVAVFEKERAETRIALAKIKTEIDELKANYISALKTIEALRATGLS